MTDAIAHRGPDGEGHYIDGALGLGHRRLAIIDLSPQPATSRCRAPDGRYILSYNGEIYNFRELRVELEARGHRFARRTDTEVVLYALAEWGEDALLRFNGMFAFALWDRDEGTLSAGARSLRHQAALLHPLALGRLRSARRSRRSCRIRASRSSIDRKRCSSIFTFQNFFTDRTAVRRHPALAACVGDARRQRSRTPYVGATGTISFASREAAR